MTAIPNTFKIGDHVRWNSEAARVSGVIIKKITSDMKFKGYVHHASREAPQYLIKSDKTEHVAIHKGAVLRLLPTRERKSSRTMADETMTNDERMQRDSNLIATIRKKLPDFTKACTNEMELVLLHQDALAADYQDDEYMLLGMAIKYAGRRWKEVRVIGKNRSALARRKKSSERSA